MKTVSKIAQIQPVIICGGSGTRLWPLSRKNMPKQFLRLFDNESLFQHSVRLASQIPGARAPIIVAASDTTHLVSRQMIEVGIEAEAIILEPVQRNTGPAVALAAFYIAQQNRDDIMFVMPSDHLISDRDKFNDATINIREGVQAGKIMLIGLKPNTPETGYGYLQVRELPDSKTGELAVTRFVEKPDKKLAEELVASGDYLWNVGIFAFTAIHFLKSLNKHAPEIYKACKIAMTRSTHTGKIVKPEPDFFSNSPNISIDFAIIEKVRKLGAVRVEFDWNDIGTWAALADVWHETKCSKKVVLEDCKNVWAFGDKRLIAAVGLEDVLIVDTEDALLIMPHDRAQDVGKVAEYLLLSREDEVMDPAVVEKPWGSYQSVHHGNSHQVKELIVAPGEVLSLQYHHHRFEHWVVVSGIAEVTVDEEVKTLKENEYAYIPCGAVHRLKNPGIQPLHLIEIQYGSYLGEDDIVRLEDVYQRVPAEQIVTSELELKQCSPAPDRANGAARTGMSYTSNDLKGNA